MRAVQWSRHGDPADAAELVDLPAPAAPAADEAQLAPEFSPVNPADLLRLQGRYGAAPGSLPAFAGGEGVARVLAVGRDVRHLAAGDRVLVPLGRGCWREVLNVPAAPLFALPDADPLQLAMAGINPPTAWQLLHGIVPLAGGDWIVQNAAASAVGRMVVQLARRRGLRSVNIVRRAEQADDLRRLGADAVVVDGPGLAERVAAQVQAPVRLGIDAVAGPATGALAQTVADGGTVVTYGLLSGHPCTVQPHDLVFRDVRLQGFWLARCWSQPGAAAMKAVYADIVGSLQAGLLHTPVAAVYPLAQLREALLHAAQPARDGKVLLRINEGR